MTKLSSYEVIIDSEKMRIVKCPKYLTRWKNTAKIKAILTRENSLGKKTEILVKISFIS